MPATATQPAALPAVAPEAVRLHAFAVASLAAAQCRKIIMGRRNGGDSTQIEWPLEARVSIDTLGVLHLHVEENAVHTREISVAMANAVYAAVRAALTEAGIGHKCLSWKARSGTGRSYWFRTGDWYMGHHYTDGRRAEIRITD